MECEWAKLDIYFGLWYLWQIFFFLLFAVFHSSKNCSELVKPIQYDEKTTVNLNRTEPLIPIFRFCRTVWYIQIGQKPFDFLYHYVHLGHPLISMNKAFFRWAKKYCLQIMACASIETIFSNAIFEDFHKKILKMKATATTISGLLAIVNTFNTFSMKILLCLSFLFSNLSNQQIHSINYK